MENFNILPPSNRLKEALRKKIDSKTKPLGALGELEALAMQLGQIQDTLQPVIQRPVMLVFAGDHGIVESGVSPYPQAVTAQMVHNFLNGGAGINVFARQMGWQLRVVDAGVNADFSPVLDMAHVKAAKGTRNFLHEPAMTAEQCEQALALGAALVQEEIAQGSNLLAFGEMGIGNTSAASCLMSVLCGIPVAECVGRGTGLDDEGLVRKANILEQALAKHSLENPHPLEALATFGGHEIAMMAGAMLAAAKHRTTMLIDGFIATSALLVAAKYQPHVLDYCVFAHCSGEAGHRNLLHHLQARPLLDLGLRLGEGTGAALALPLLQAAVNFLNEMASFESAGVSEKNA